MNLHSLALPGAVADQEGFVVERGAFSLPDALLVDLDGTLIQGGAAIPGAAAFVARHRDRLAIVSNNSTDTPADLSARLMSLGLDVSPRCIILAGMVAIDHIARMHPRAGIMLLGSQALYSHAMQRGLDPNAIDPGLVLVARDELFDFAKLAAAANAIRTGAKFYATNSDAYHPGMAGRRVPETGSLMLAIMAVAGRSPDKVFGKPDPHLLTAALSRLNATKGSAVMIGDNPATDGLAAIAAKIPFVQVGETTGRTIADIRFTASV